MFKLDSILEVSVFFSLICLFLAISFFLPYDSLKDLSFQYSGKPPFTTVLILDGSSKHDAHVWGETGHLTG